MTLMIVLEMVHVVFTGIGQNLIRIIMKKNKNKKNYAKGSTVRTANY